MSDELSELFRERFSGHESPVDPSVWQAIQSGLGASAPAVGDDAVEKLFRERFQGHEVPVDPGVWAQVSGQLGQGVAASATTGTALAPLGWAAAGLGVLAIAGAVHLYNGPSDKAEPSSPGSLTVEQPMPEPEPEAIALPILQTPAGAPVEEVPERVDTEDRARPAAPARPRPAAEEQRSPTMPPDLSMTDEARRAPETADAVDGAVLVERIIERVTEEARMVAPRTAPEPLAEPEDDLPEEASEVLPAAELPKLFLPNTFTPNGDGINDTYEVLNPGAFERILTRVYAVRSNQLVFSTDQNIPWTGENCPDGYYLVAVEAVTPDGRLVAEGKVVWLNRNTMH